MAFQFETSHERHMVDVAPHHFTDGSKEFIAYIASYPGCDILELGTFSTKEQADSAVTVAMLAMQRVTR